MDRLEIHDTKLRYQGLDWPMPSLGAHRLRQRYEHLRVQAPESATHQFWDELLDYTQKYEPQPWIGVEPTIEPAADLVGLSAHSRYFLQRRSQLFSNDGGPTRTSPRPNASTPLAISASTSRHLAATLLNSEYVIPDSKGYSTSAQHQPNSE